MSISRFLKRQITVAHVYDIPVRIDYRWFIVFALCLWLIAFYMQLGAMRLVTAAIEHGDFRIIVMHLPPVAASTAWFLALLTTLALFLSVFGHELSHALMARAEGIDIEEIVLHPFGGLARMKREPDSPRAEFRIAIAGPASSFLFSIAAFVCMSLAAMAGQRATAAVFFFLSTGNLLLAIFNLFPGYPLDGGRVLRALLWHRSGNINEATRTSSLGGQLVAWTLIVLGFYPMVIRWHAYLMGFWSVLVGLFLRSAAASVMKHGAKQVTVADAMSAPLSIEPDVTVSHFIDNILPLHRQTSFLVARGGQLHGILTLEDLKSLPRERWRSVRARDVMRPVSPQFFVGPSTTMAHADRLMQQNGTNSLAVVNGRGELVGFLQRGKLKRRKK